MRVVHVDVGKWEVRVRRKVVGKLVITRQDTGRYLLSSVEVAEAYWRQGCGTALMAALARWLYNGQGTSLHASNEGSGTVQLLNRAFGSHVKYYGKGRELTYEEAVHVMDVEFGYTRADVDLETWRVAHPSGCPSISPHVRVKSTK